MEEGGLPNRKSMTPSSESQRNLEAVRLTAILSTKATTRIGTWNVRTMYEAGKTAQVAAEMRAYKLCLLGIAETRWTGSGERRLMTGETLLYSGHEEEDAPHTSGVALMLSKSAKKALAGWEAHGPRILSATFQTKHKRIKLCVVQCYAPTNDGEEEQKEDFYHRLEAVCQSLSGKGLLLLMGDLNAKIGSENRGYEEVMGQHGLGMMNDNGERLANFCAANDLVIGGSLFPHRRIHKATWVSPDHLTENQIDHICVSRRFRRSLNDVRVKRGADAASDHHLLIGSLRLKLKRAFTGETGHRVRYNTALLREDAKREEFKLTLSNKFQVLEELREDQDLCIQEEWSALRVAFSDTCKEVLGPKKISHKDWISAGTLKLIHERKEKKAAVNCSCTRAEKTRAEEAYSEVNKSTQRSIKADK